MLSSIHPLGERAKGNRFAVTAAAHVVGAALGGATTGALVGAVGQAFEPWRSSGTAAVAAAAACLAAVAADAGAFGRLPSWRRQVNEQWLDEYRGAVYGFGFGYQLGMGVVTIVTSAATYAALACALLAGSMGAGTAIGLAFGATRGLTLLAASRLDSPQQLRSFHRALASAAPRARSATVATLALAASALMFVGATA